MGSISHKDMGPSGFEPESMVPKTIRIDPSYHMGPPHQFINR